MSLTDKRDILFVCMFVHLPTKKRNHPFLLRHHIDFLKQSFRNLRSTGSVTPSSRYLCRAIVRKIDAVKAKVVVELGPGDGVVTQHILDRLDPDAKLFIFEINDTFIAHLKARFDDPRLIVVHDSAENMGFHFSLYEIDQVDYIISGIPFVMLPEHLVVEIVQTCKKWLKPGAVFIQFHYSPLLIPLYRRIFGNAGTDLVPLNIPPALVVSCVKEN